MSLAIAGNYMTFIQGSDGKWSSGPLIVIGQDTSVTVDGIAIVKPAIGANVSWNASDGNPSSADLAFYTNASGQSCYGKYAQGSGPLPSSPNLSGTAQAAPQQLSNWNGTYNTFTYDGSKWNKDSTLVVDGATVTYNGQQISNYIYTGVAGTGGTKDLDQLAWFVSGGNADNAIVSLIVSGGYNTFAGVKWDSGAEPAANNFSGTTAPTPSPPTITVEIVLALVAKVTSEVAEAETTEAETVEAETVEAETVEAEVVEAEVVEAEVIVLIEEDEKARRGSDDGPDVDDDARAADDLADKSDRLSNGNRKD